MPTATLPQLWRGRSGRDYVPAEGGRVRHGALATVRKVVGRGPPRATSTVAEGVPLALKLWTEGDDPALDQLQVEARAHTAISAAATTLPCPRLYDLVGTPLATGLVMEWCPSDLERWWTDQLRAPDAFGRLMAVFAEISRRLAEYGAIAAKVGLDPSHGDLKPTNVLLATDGRWLVSDFGPARVRAPDDNPLVTTKVAAGAENFIAPERLFHARSSWPVAADAWSLGATLFALLRLQRLVLDGSPIPKNGCLSPRFRMRRVEQVVDVYSRDPTRFVDRELDPGLFADPLRLPEEDRRVVLDAVHGLFGPDGEAREQELGRELCDVFDRSMTIEPQLRYTDARDLSAAFEKLVRVYLELSSQGRKAPPPQKVEDEGAAVRARREAEARVESLTGDLETARERISELEGAVAAIQADRDALAARPPVVMPKAKGPPAWWGGALVLVVVLQAATLTLITVMVVLAVLGR